MKLSLLGKYSMKELNKLSDKELLDLYNKENNIFDKKVYKEMNLTGEVIETMNNTTVVQLAQQLEDDLVHMCRVDENMTVLDYIKNCLKN